MMVSLLTHISVTQPQWVKTRLLLLTISLLLSRATTDTSKSIIILCLKLDPHVKPPHPNQWWRRLHYWADAILAQQNRIGLNRPILRPLWLITSAAPDVTSVPGVLEGIMSLGSQKRNVNATATDASSIRTLTMQDKWGLVFHEVFQLLVPSQCWEMFENVNTVMFLLEEP